MIHLNVLYLIVSLVCHSDAIHYAIIKHPNSDTPFPALVSDYSWNSIDLSESKKGKLIHHSSDPKGCSEWQSISQNPDLLNIGFVDRGDCTFLEKSKQAQLSGLDIILVISNDDKIEPMGADENDLQEYQNEYKTIILSIMTSQSFKTFLSNNNNNYPSEIELIEYKMVKKSMDMSMILMIFIATFLVSIGAYYSSDTERWKMYNNNRDNNTNTLRQRVPVQEINAYMAWSFIIIASISLLLLYFFVDKIFIIIVFIFCMGATNGLSTIFSHFFDYLFPHFQNKTYFLKQFDIEFTLSDLLGFIPAFIITLIWFLNRQTSQFAWILQNIMCIGLLLILQRTIRLTNLRIASILLCTAFFYDIFWVFISPYLFESSVMVAVATYQHNNNQNDTLPVVIKLPKFTNDNIFASTNSSPMILGLGDIALPGLLISYLLRFDYINKIGIKSIKHNIKYGYFIIGCIGYAFGMLLTDINLILMQSGQPALLFLVPCTLGTSIVVAYKRGHLKKIWNGNHCCDAKNMKMHKSPPITQEYILRD